jgi:hypothetical protein
VADVALDLPGERVARIVAPSPRTMDAGDPTGVVATVAFPAGDGLNEVHEVASRRRRLPLQHPVADPACRARAWPRPRSA